MHNAACAVLGLDAVYVGLRVTSDDLADVVTGLRAVGAAGNITVPHKVAFAALADERTETAARIGAVNTFWATDGVLHADNTDVDGVLAATEGMPAPWTILGTGGGARAAAEAARRRGVPAGVRSRAEDRARAFVEWAKTIGLDDVRVVDAVEPGGTVINATPLGLRADDPLPLADADLERAGAIMDMAYAAGGGTRLVRQAVAAGVRCTDGRTMLVAQAAAAFERFFPGVEAPREVMAAAAQRVLA
jgi:shikimate dehydrogenase